jgi:2-aminoadipate transaminase
MVLTSGSGEAIGILIQALTDPGDVVLVEEFVYLGTLNQMRRYGADVVGVKCDDDGIIPEALDSVITEQTGKGKRVKYLYTIPQFQNPLGWTMSLERRKQVLDVTGKHGIPIFEDDCYADLRFEGEDVTSFHSLDDTGRVVYAGSFSKIIAPGMRMGYLVAPKPVIARAWSFKSGGAVSQFTALTIAELMKGGLNQHIEVQNRALAAKRDAMVAALGENFGGSVTWTVPQGGLYIWVKFPEGTDLAAVQEEIFHEGVSYYNGSQFSPTGEGSNYVRLCFGHPSIETIRDGIAELARILDSKKVLPA